MDPIFGMFRLIYRRPLLLVCALILVFTLESIASQRKFLQNSRGLYWRSHLGAISSETFKSIPITGFDYDGSPNKSTCESLRHTGHSIGVEQSFFLPDDIFEIAKSLDSHELVEYPPKLHEKTMNIHNLIRDTWARLAASCVYLAPHRIYLCVTRVIFYQGDRRDWATINFLRGQVFDLNWQHLQNYTLKWNNEGEALTFPLIYDTPTEYDRKGLLFGPEDPRIIIEEDVPESEPVIVFNMKTSKAQWKRAMWVYRPFSGRSAMLGIEGRERNKKEKNWAPFYLRNDPGRTWITPKPNDYLHFVYSFDPLQILCCHLDSGECNVVFEQIHSGVSHGPRSNSSLRGGTQWIPVPLPKPRLRHNEIQAYVSFPRTNLMKLCGKRSFYRPELVVMITNGTSFFLSYVSESLDFGGLVMDSADFVDPCGKGRILIANSIASWETNLPDGKDVMTVTFTVDDATVQVARIRGILKLVSSLPSYQRIVLRTEEPVFNSDELYFNHRVGGEIVRECLEQTSEAFGHALIDSSVREKHT